MNENVKWAVALVVGFVAGFLPTIMDRRYNEKRLRRDKKEYLYENITEWYNYFFCQVRYFYLVFEKKIDWNRYLDLIIEMENKGNYLKDEIIVEIYFPEICKSLEKLTSNVQSLDNFINHEIKESYEKGDDISSYRENVSEKWVICNKLFEQVQNDIKKIKL